MTRNYKIIIIVCIAAVLCNIAARFYLIGDQNREIIVLQQVVAAARSGSYIEKEASPPILKHSPEDDLKKIIAAIPKEFSFTQYVSKISSLIDSNHIRTEKNMIFTPEKTISSVLLKYNTRLDLKGNYADLKKTITDILNLPGLLYIESLSFDRDGSSSQEDFKAEDRVRMQCELSVFFKRTET